jgi:hypothetical protein
MEALFRPKEVSVLEESRLRMLFIRFAISDFGGFRIEPFQRDPRQGRHFARVHGIVSLTPLAITPTNLHRA